MPRFHPRWLILEIHSMPSMALPSSLDPIPAEMALRLNQEPEEIDWLVRTEATGPPSAQAGARVAPLSV